MLYLPLRTASVHDAKAHAKMEHGIWLGVNARTEEVFIGTKKGVVTCRTIRRLAEAERWDAKLVHEMEGTTWQPVPDIKSDHTPAETDDDGTPHSRGEEDEDAVEYKPFPVEEDVDTSKRQTRSSKVIDIRVTHKDVTKYVATPGFLACEYVRQNRTIAVGVAHPEECRQRIREAV